jgi:L-aspartate oxidase
MSEPIPRYLIPFHPKEMPHFFTDVLIIGGGLAGLRAAIAVDPTQSALVVTKDRLDESNSAYAQGGIAGVMDPEDRFENHVADTLKAGGDLCDPQVVEMVVREAPQRIRSVADQQTEHHRPPTSGQPRSGRHEGRFKNPRSNPTSTHQVALPQVTFLPGLRPRLRPVGGTSESPSFKPNRANLL